MNFTKKDLKKKEMKALSNFDILKIFNNKVKIYTYNELTDFNDIFDAFYPYDCIFLLFETNKNFGHWVCLINKKNSIEFFDSYGIFPDKELKYSKISFRLNNNMLLPHLTALLYNCNKQIEYNDHKLQNIKNKYIATCGRWCVFRYMCKEFDIDVFANFFKNKKYNPDEMITILTYFI